MVGGTVVQEFQYCIWYESQSTWNLSYWLSDSWKVSLVDAGCADHLLTVGDLELQQKATDIIVLLLAEG